MNKKLEILYRLKDEKELELELINKEINKIKEANKINKVKDKTSKTTKEVENIVKERVEEVSYEEKEQNFSDLDLLRDLRDFPRYLINGHMEVFHETGIRIPEFEKGGKKHVKLFDRENNEVEVEVSKLK